VKIRKQARKVAPDLHKEGSGARGTRTSDPVLANRQSPLSPPTRLNRKEPAQQPLFNPVGSGSGRVIQKMISQIPPN
jgi:hypothetical protein